MRGALGDEEPAVRREREIAGRLEAVDRRGGRATARPSPERGAIAGSAAAARSAVTRSGAERALSSTPPSLTNDASSSVCAPAVIAGSRAVQGIRRRPRRMRT